MCLPVLCLSFDYAGTHIGSNDVRQRFFISQGAGLRSVERNRAREAAARAELERFGAIELSCLEGYTESYGSTADYLVALDGDAHLYCAFSAQAVPELRARGFVVQIDADYPYQVLAEEPSWYVDVKGAEAPAGSFSGGSTSGARPPDSSGWFACEIGVEIDGRRVNLLTALLDLLQSMPDAAAGGGGAPRSRRAMALAVDEVHYVRIPRELLDELLGVLRELYSGKRAPSPPPALLLNRYQGAGLAALEGVLSRRGKVLRTGPRLPLPPATLDAPRPSERTLVRSQLDTLLRPYQREGVRWLLGLRAENLSGVLADDMGLGKTLQTITLLWIEHVARAVEKPTLVVVPTSLISNWKRELARFAPEIPVSVWHGSSRTAADHAELGRARVIVTSYGLLVRELERWQARDYHYLILDEAQTIKNPRSVVREAACSLQAQQRLCLSGTPVENHLGDLWSLFDFLLPGLLGNAAQFQESYRNPIEEQRDEDKLQALRRNVRPFILRRTKEQVARDLPPKSIFVRPIQLGSAQRRLYESIRIAAHADVRRMVQSKGIGGSTIAILDALMKLRQVCCDPRLVPVEAARKVEESAKLSFLFRLLTAELGEQRRILIFSQFTSMLGLIGKGLDARDIPFALLTGATADRQRQVDDFQTGKVPVFLISLKAGGTGLNLTSADTVIHYDPWWNPAAQAQATDRAHRIGQTRPVFVHQLIVSGSVEERMLDLQRHKRELADSLTSVDADGPSFSERELTNLFSPLEPPVPEAAPASSASRHAADAASPASGA
jgi:superfamily II DNA or RNA helicase